jgi:hypothetical protein
MRRSILDRAFVKEGYAVFRFPLCYLLRPFRADRVYCNATQAKALAKFPRPFGPKPASKSDRVPGWRLCEILGLVPITRVALTCPAEGLAKEEGP